MTMQRAAGRFVGVLAVAVALLATPMSPAPAQRIAMTPERSAARGSPVAMSIRATSDGEKPLRS